MEEKKEHRKIRARGEGNIVVVIVCLQWHHHTVAVTTITTTHQYPPPSHLTSPPLSPTSITIIIPDSRRVAGGFAPRS